MTHAIPRIPAMALVAALLVGCNGAVDPVPAAVLESEGDTPCTTDDDCVVWYNGCFATASCWHTDDVDATPDVICDPPDYAPPVASCVCDDLCVVD